MRKLIVKLRNERKSFRKIEKIKITIELINGIRKIMDKYKIQKI